MFTLAQLTATLPKPAYHNLLHRICELHVGGEDIHAVIFSHHGSWALLHFNNYNALLLFTYFMSHIAYHQA